MEPNILYEKIEEVKDDLNTLLILSNASYKVETDYHIANDVYCVGIFKHNKIDRFRHTSEYDINIKLFNGRIDLEYNSSSNLNVMYDLGYIEKEVVLYNFEDLKEIIYKIFIS